MTNAWKFVCGLTNTRLPSINSVCGGNSTSRSRSSAVNPPGGGRNQSGTGPVLPSTDSALMVTSPIAVAGGTMQYAVAIA